jgi:nucleoside-diphosphate-sugar epimerase
LSRLIRRFGFKPLVGGGPGLRQPVHVEDLAIGAIAAASSPASVNKIYSVPGGETLTYRELVGRIFDGMRRALQPFPECVEQAADTFSGPC